ncbi:relaxase/mobilization nuclease domain-containing protein [Rhodocytophaga rosea]|uniref:Relaxase/mobilization nuclease domain-containing protein n=1 Tax=Rhodocytophaga rosea TaxID=2704465 RepID=A0A6C0GBW2_9BACT|nr:relaxase/mobilization nuclease domain-containing protein [Rhodocytophaga rosea]QHT65378.1 relaxase/mobilization nuclease domain-containing protein [Rhodocytophaga rosea]
MIGKLSMGAGAVGAISYCYYDKKATDGNGEKAVRGELLYSNEVFITKLPNTHLHLQYLAAQYHQVAQLNTKTEKFIWHQTFNFPPGENVSNETMVKIACDFAREFGFEHNQYLVFRHRDKPHEHFHIIANRINANGQNTATDRKNYERIQLFCREMENKYGLQVTKSKQKSYAQSSSVQADKLRKLIDKHLPTCQTLSELSIALKKQDVIMYLGRGISFTDRNSGVTFKGSALSRHYSRSQIESRLGKSLVLQAPNSKQIAISDQSGSKNLNTVIKSKFPSQKESLPVSKMISEHNNATETRKDLAKINESLRSVKNRKVKRRIN